MNENMWRESRKEDGVGGGAEAEVREGEWMGVTKLGRRW